MAETDLSDWLTLVGASQVIGCSTRTVERLGRAKKLEQRLRRQDGTPPVAVYNPDDVARIASERHQAPPAFVLPAVQAGNGNGRGHPASSIPNIGAGDMAYRRGEGDPIRQLAAYVLHALQSPPSPPVAEKVAERPILTLEEAVDASGWTRTYLLRKIHHGTLKAVKDGGWKIRRCDLEQL
jgi:hypothetical protein